MKTRWELPPQTLVATRKRTSPRFNFDSNTVSILLGTGGGKFATAASYPISSGSGPTIVAADFNNDEYPDIATANGNLGTVSVLLNQGNGTFGSYKDYAAGNFGCALVAGDFNNDGNVDLIVGNSGIGLSLLLGKGDGSFAAPIVFGTGLNPCSIAMGDFNGDGNLDLATVANSWLGNSVSVLLGNGNGTFRPAVNYATADGTIQVIATDLNRDGITDLAVLTGLVNEISELLGNGDGTFQTYVAIPAPFNPSALLSADFNGKGIQDLAVLSYLSGTVNILPGSGVGGFGTSAEYYLGPYTQAFLAADLDGNGSNDLAATNGPVLGAVTVLLNSPVVVLSASALTFPTTRVGTKSAAQTVILRNPGTAPVSLRSIGILGTGAADFVETNNCHSLIPIGKTCEVQVVFQPTRKARRSAVVRFTDSALSRVQTVLLTGIGD